MSPLQSVIKITYGHPYRMGGNRENKTAYHIILPMSGFIKRTSTSLLITGIVCTLQSSNVICNQNLKDLSLAFVLFLLADDVK